MKKNAFFVLSVVLTTFGLAFSNNHKTDSLNNVLKNAVGQEKAKTLNELAIYWINTNPDKAREYASQAYTTAIRANDENQKFESLFIKASSFYNQNKYDEAALILNELLEKAKKAKNKNYEAKAHNSLGNIHLKFSKYTQALSSYHSSLILRQSINDKTEIIHSFINIGNVYKKLGKYELAFQNFAEALQISQSIKNLKTEGNIINHIGGVYWEQKNFKKALECYQQSLEIRKKLNDSIEMANASNNIGMVYSDLGNFEEAIHYLTIALKLKQKYGTNPDIAFSYNALGNVYHRLNLHEKALQNYTNALNLREKTNDKMEIAKSIDNIGGVYMQIPHYEKALDYFSRSLQIRLDLKLESETAISYTFIGNAYWKLNSYDKAFENYMQALQIREQINDHLQTANSLCNIALVYKDLENYDKSVFYYLQATEKFKKANNKVMLANTTNQIAGVYWASGNFSKALELYLHCLEMREEIGDKKNIAHTYNNIGLIYRELNDLKKSLEFYHKALDGFKAIGDQSGMAMVLHNLGNYYSKTNQANLAVQFYNQAILLRQTIQDKSGLANSNRLLGELYLNLNQPSRALPFLKDAEKFAAEIKEAEFSKHCFFNLHQYYKLIGSYQNALNYFELYTAQKDSIFNLERAKRIAEMQLRYETGKKQTEIELLNHKNQLISLKLKNETYFRYFLLFLILLFSYIFYLLYKRFKLKQQIIAMLKKSNEETLKLNEELNEAKTKLQELNYSKDRFFSIIAHDLKNPFSAIMSVSELLLISYDNMPPEKQKLFIEQLFQTSTQLHALLENLLDWSKSQTGQLVFQPKEISLTESIENVIHLLQVQAEKKQISMSHSIPEMKNVFFDPYFLHTILRNLIGNAIKFTPSGGKITAGITEEFQNYKITITDTGVGMSSSEAMSVFRGDMRHSTPGTNEEKGTGLGLLLCKELAEKAGESIWVESKPGLGSSFSFTIKKYDAVK